VADVVASYDTIGIISSTGHREHRQKSQHKGVRRRGGTTNVHAGERDAEEARERVAQAEPPGIDST
jgi:hypothetical protein